MPPREAQHPQHTQWPSPISDAHQQHFGHAPHSSARVPGTWPLIGEHSDAYGGMSLHAFCDRESELSFSPTRTGNLRIVWEELDGPTRHIEVAIDARAQELTASQETQGHTLPEDDETCLGSLLALTMSSLHQRQMTSRSVQGADVVIRSTVPRGVGLGALSSLHVAFALAATCTDSGVDIPTRARLADVLAHSAHLVFPARPALSRLHALLRSSDTGHSFVNHADGAVTRCPSILSPSTRLWLVTSGAETPYDNSSLQENLAQRHELARRAAHDFGTPHLRLLPHARTRVPEWLHAYRQVHGAEGQPTPEDAHAWLSFWEQETDRAAQLSSALHTRHHSTAWSLLHQSTSALHNDYGITTPDIPLAELCQRAGALAARPVLAGLSPAVIVYTDDHHAQDVPQALSAHGLHAVELHEGLPSSVRLHPSDATR